MSGIKFPSTSPLDVVKVTVCSVNQKGYTPKALTTKWIFPSFMDWVNKIGQFADEHLRKIKTSAYLLASLGIIIIVRKSHAISVFTDVKAIPEQFVAKHIPFKVRVSKVLHNDANINGVHIPIFFARGWIRQMLSGNGDKEFTLRLLGVEPRDGMVTFLQDTIVGCHVKVVPYSVSVDDVLGCVIYRPQKWMRLFRYHVNLNEELIRNGLAVVRNESNVPIDTSYSNLFNRLLRAEIVAEKKRRGIWEEESRWRKMLSKVSEIAESLQRRFLFWRK